MLKKQLCVLIICFFLFQPNSTLTSEKDTYVAPKNDTVATVDQHKTAPLEPLADSDDTLDGLEDDFLDSYVRPEPTRSEKLLAFIAPYIAPCLIALLPCYIYVSGGVDAMKLRAAACCQAIKRYKAKACGTNNKD